MKGWFQQEQNHVDRGGRGIGRMITTSGKDGKEGFLVLPDEQFAMLALKEAPDVFSEGITVDRISLEKWVSQYPPDISMFGDLVWVFPEQGLTGAVIQASDMLRDLSKELVFLNAQH